MTLLALAFVAIVIAILSWSAGTAMLLWASRQRRREGVAAAAAQAAPPPAPADVPPPASDAPEQQPSREDVCRAIVAELGDAELKEAALMLTALAEHGRVMVASRDPGREELARRVVDELAIRSAAHDMGPPITATDGEVVGAAVFRAVEGLGQPLLAAAEEELMTRATMGASSSSAV